MAAQRAQEAAVVAPLLKINYVISESACFYYGGGCC